MNETRGLSNNVNKTLNSYAPRTISAPTEIQNNEQRRDDF